MMNLNNDNHIVKKLINLEEENYNNIKISAYFICKDKLKDDYYFSKSVELDEPIEEFLIGHIINKIKDLTNADSQDIAVQSYNQEFKLTGYIGEFNVDKYELSNKVVKNLGLLRKAMVEDKLENIKKSNFQIISLTLNNETVSFCFYKSVKKQAKTKKMAIWSSEVFKAINKELVEFGGNFSFFMDSKNIFILDPRYFEWAFDYKDHIAEKSKNNIERLTSMEFFPDEVTKKAFKRAAGHHLLVRGVASMDDSVINEVEKHFTERVAELKEIRNRREEIEDVDELKKFKKEIGELDDLINYIDFRKNRIIFKEKDDPTPLLHFFQDKIVESFLTKRIKVALSIS